MADKTNYYNLVKPTESEYGDVSVLNGNMDIIDGELHKRGTTVNGEGPDDHGNYQVNEVEFARQIVSEDNQQSSGTFLERTTGGNASLNDGAAKLVSIAGRSIHTGATAENIDWALNVVPREEGELPIEMTLDRDTFVAYVQSSGTIVLTYTNAWSANPALYGITIIGDPVAGDSITIVYVKEERGLIINSAPTKLISTGWNLYDNAKGYARVLKYSDTYGFLVGGTYSTLQFSETIEGTKTTISPVSGYFTIPSDGYVWVSGGNATNTYILMTWSDWDGGYEGEWMAYSESVIDGSEVMENFPLGLMQVGAVADEVDFDLGKAYSRIERMNYTAENLEIVKASGRPWEADENYIYAVREYAIEYSVEIDNDYIAYDHGLEIIEGGEVPVFVRTIYGDNLVDKLRHDIPNRLDGHDTAIRSLCQTISGTTNNCGHTINSGEYFIANGGKYKATASIPVNGAWSGSAQAVSDNDLINALNNRITNSYSNTLFENQYVNIRFRQWNKVCMLSIEYDNPKVNMTAGNDYTLNTLPVGSRPAQNMYLSMPVYLGTSPDNAVFQITITSGGAVIINPSKNITTGQFIFASMIFLCK